MCKTCLETVPKQPDNKCEYMGCTNTITHIIDIDDGRGTYFVCDDHLKAITRCLQKIH